MAKGSAMGLWKGKKGSSVFYQIKNSNSLQKQGVRERNYEPANPQTARQAGQRMRMYPAQAVYGAIKSVIERSWQGVKYGQMSRQAYLKRALRAEIFPAVAKGDGVVVPGPYQIAKGTLQEYAATTTGNGRIIIPIFCGEILDWDSTVADFATSVLTLNPGLREGDQITIVCCHTNADGDGFYWDYTSVILDTSSTDTMGIVWGKIATTSDELAVGGAGIQLISDNYIYMAAACIVSREAETPQRSNATLACDYERGGMPNYYSAEAVARAKRSYMRPLTVTETDWPADPADDGGGSAGDDYTITVNQVTIQAGGTEDSKPGGTVSGGGSYLIGERVTLTATTDGSHDFTGWYPSKEDALANTNRISTAGIFMFTAGDQYENVTTFFGKFMPQL